MRKEHILKTNKLLFISHLLVSVFLIMGLFSQLMLSSLNAAVSIIPIISVVILFICGIFIFIKYKRELTYSYYVGIGFSIVYLILLTLASNGNAFAYMIPILFILISTYDVKIIKITSIMFLITNILRVILSVIQSTDMNKDIEMIMIESIVTILVFIAVNRCVNLIEEFYETSMNEISALLDSTKDMDKKILKVASDVEDQSNDISVNLKEITKTTNDMKASMNYISKTVNDTNDKTLGQKEQADAIHNIIDDVHIQTEDMVKNSDNSKQVLNAGTLALNNLFDKVNDAIISGKNMKDTVTALKNKSEAVKGITDIILEISSQTNLLALNARIEAARAGENGKGFAVVASEIGNLANQTKEETENITKLIEELTSNTNKMGKDIDNNVDISMQENVLAKEASDKFKEITDTIESLSININKLNDLMKSLLNATNTIIENINIVSQNTNDVDMNIKDVYTISEKNAQMVNEFGRALEKIIEQIKSLQNIN